MLEIREQGVPAVGRDSGLGQVFREELGTGLDLRRTREEIRIRHPRRKGALPPHDLVEQVLHPFDRRKQRRPRRALDRVSGESAEQFPVRIVDAQFAAEDLRRLSFLRIRAAGPLAQADVTDDPVRQPPVRQPHALPAEGQIGDRTVRSVQVARRSDDLEAAVQEEWMDFQGRCGRGLRGTRLPPAPRPGGPRPGRGCGKRDRDRRLSPLWLGSSQPGPLATCRPSVRPDRLLSRIPALELPAKHSPPRAGSTALPPPPPPG